MDNLMICRRRGPGTSEWPFQVKVIDFGLSHKDEGKCVSDDELNNLNGLRYLAPEGLLTLNKLFVFEKCKSLVLFGAPVGTPSDMWSFGCLIKFLLLNDDTTDVFYLDFIKVVYNHSFAG
jgi:serine/threonine protein kinase